MQTINNLSALAFASPSVSRQSSEGAQKTSMQTDIKPSADGFSVVSTQVVTNNSAAARLEGNQLTNNASGQREQVEKAVFEMNDFFQTVQRNLQFSLDDESGKMVVQIKDEKGKVVKQIPTEEALELARRLDEFRGLLFEEKV